MPSSAQPQIDREAEASINDLPPDDEFFLDDEENLQDDVSATGGGSFVGAGGMLGDTLAVRE